MADYTLQLSYDGTESGKWDWIGGQPSALNINDTITVTVLEFFGPIEQPLEHYQSLSVGATMQQADGSALPNAPENWTLSASEIEEKLDTFQLDCERGRTGLYFNITPEGLTPGSAYGTTYKPPTEIKTDDLFLIMSVRSENRAFDHKYYYFITEVVLKFSPDETTQDLLGSYSEESLSLCLVCDYGDPRKGSCSIPVKK